MVENRLLLLGCGILRKETRLLIEKNRWPMDTMFLDSALLGAVSQKLKETACQG